MVSEGVIEGNETSPYAVEEIHVGDVQHEVHDGEGNEDRRRGERRARVPRQFL